MMMLRQPMRHLHGLIKVQHQPVNHHGLLTSRVKQAADRREIICRATNARAANTDGSSSDMLPLEGPKEDKSSGRGHRFWTIVATMVPLVGKSCCLNDGCHSSYCWYGV